MDATQLKPYENFQTTYQVVCFHRRERGSFLLESLIAMIVLAIGLGGLSSLLIASLYTNHRSSQDTSSTMVAEHVLEQISAQPANSCHGSLCDGLRRHSLEHQHPGTRTGSRKWWFLWRGWCQSDFRRRRRLDPGLRRCAGGLRHAVCRLREWWEPDRVRRTLEPDHHEQLRPHGHHFSASIRSSGQRRAQICNARKSADHWRTLSMRNSGSPAYPNKRLTGFSLIEMLIAVAIVSAVLAVVMRGIIQMQQRSKTESTTRGRIATDP